MSTPEKNQNKAVENATGDQPVNLAEAVGQLRVLVCGLGAGLLVVSLVLSAFVYKQNRNLTGAITARRRQITQMQNSQQPVMFALNDLAKYSLGKPELMAIFTKHGIQITPPAGAGGPSTPVTPPVH
jgi:hypothetical protein